ncbi:MAG: hypothetical protein IKM39_03045 [Clostridia bacterium]|nr:hypothetical protein [Clostridia bacterium]
MKQTILAVLLIVLLAFSGPVGVRAEARELPLGLAFYTFGMDNENQTLHTTLHVENKTATDVSCVFYTVIQNEDGNADSCHTTRFVAKPGENLISVVHSYKTAGNIKNSWSIAGTGLCSLWRLRCPTILPLPSRLPP